MVTNSWFNCLLLDNLFNWICFVGSIVGSTFTMLLIIVLAIIKQDPFFDYEYDIFFPIFTAIIYVIVIIRHKANITRLKQKTESQVKWEEKNLKWNNLRFLFLEK